LWEFTVFECETLGEKRGAYTVLVGRYDGKRPLEIPRRKWEQNIKKALQ
jgi:hypothetical protein